ncbi:helix-turn-helix domain-containing protein [Leucobacter sp. UCMA 4100]|uniref:helix-turn-helix domain-containing protein n=1 Tax=Leucobacter sp. UCMA 4100 TaxID=2810534 RepID=UPI0022EB08DC|nr:helix-turn-helix domain-containing protein [Leucobacter sp. UCMA 4100]MDA3146050.1 helix-turn-helix domain-containing protein [Leucobacter sp. UCMA 4100]
MSQTNYLRALLVANDATQALQAATERAREILACDVSWAGLVEGDYLVIGAHSGLNTPEMAANWRLGLGVGIGGTAASEGRPRKSNDYQHDSRRVPAKRLIDNEGIVATLVVPIMTAEKAVGVLYVGFRGAHHWQDDEVTTLEAVSHDVAVRLKQLDVDGSTQLVARQQEARALLAEEELRAAAEFVSTVWRNNEVGSVLTALAAALDAQVTLVDDGGHELFIARRGITDREGPREAMNVGEVVVEHAGGLRLRWQRPAAAAPFSDALDAVLLGAAQLHLQRLAERERAFESFRGELVEQMLTGKGPDDDTMRRRVLLAGLGVFCEDARVLVVATREGDGLPTDAVRSALAKELPGCVMHEKATRLVILMPNLARNEPELAVRIEAVLSAAGQGAASGERGATVVGMGRACSGLPDIATSYDEAVAACEIGLSAQRTATKSRVMSARDLGLQGLASLPAAKLSTTVHETFGPLLDSDANRGTAYLATLRVFMSRDRHLQSTADELLVHYNTVRNRIARIEEMTGLDLGDVDDRFRVDTALRMAAVLGVFPEA